MTILRWRRRKACAPKVAALSTQQHVLVDWAIAYEDCQEARQHLLKAALEVGDAMACLPDCQATAEASNN